MENICRLCLDEGDKLVKLFTDSDNNETIDKIYQLSNVLITNHQSGCPTGICFNCNRLLEISWKFRKQIQDSENFLNIHFKNVSTSEDPVEHEDLKPEPEEENAFEDDDMVETLEASADEMYCEIEEIVTEIDNEEDNFKEDTDKLSNISETNEVSNEDEVSLLGEEVEDGEVLNHEFKCGICPRTFLRENWCQMHIRRHERVHKCEHCSKTFTQLGNLIRHERTHTGERPYKCSICEKQFTQIGNLHVHEKGHTGEKNYKCQLCNKQFKFLAHLNEHMKTHSDVRQFKCDACPYETHKQSSLKTHLRTHSGEKPYDCEHCSKSFNNLSNFKTHLRIHTGEKKYSCKFCRKCFVQHSSMTRHEKLHTREQKIKADSV